MITPEDDSAAGARTLAAKRALARARYGWLWPLTGINVIALILAIIGAVGGMSGLSFLFPQIWGFGSPFGATIGVITVLAVVGAGVVKSRGGVDRTDRWYRFYAGLTLASTIMFSVFLGGVGLLFLVISVGAS